MKKLLLICLCLTYIISSIAQTPDKKWNIGIYGGLTHYSGDLGIGFFSNHQARYGFFGMSASRYLGRHLDLCLFATKGEAGFIEQVTPHSNMAPFEGSFRASLSTVNLLLRYNIIGPASPVRPFVAIGAGLLIYEKNYTVTAAHVDQTVPTIGAGINFRLTPSLNILVQELFMYSTQDDIDGESDRRNDSYLFHTAGITVNIGKKHDADGDGVNDGRDKCSDTPPGVKVDEAGCPLDRDKDGVADYQDDCPDITGSVSMKGCPDKDGDGIADKDDQCPDEAGSKALYGCPDQDKDGIADKDDRCPELPGPIALKGCPDADGDGVADIDDKCPNTDRKYAVDARGCPMDNDKDGLLNEDDQCPDKAGSLGMKGCPDGDGDGVSDFDDRCPNTKGTLSNRGCPEISREDIIKVTTIASKIFFEFDKDVLVPASLPQLDALTSILKKYEGANLFLEGHTDNVGTDAYNQDLSQRRMDAVKAYLMSKGIFESRLYAVGYGEVRPIASNETENGRAKNRRVEIKLSYEEIKTKTIIKE